MLARLFFLFIVMFFCVTCSKQMPKVEYPTGELGADHNEPGERLAGGMLDPMSALPQPGKKPPKAPQVRTPMNLVPGG